MKKLAVVVGHNSKQRGAVRSDTGVSEYVWNGKLADVMEGIASEFGLTVKIFRREYVGSYSREINAVYDKVDRWGADASLELHFNAGADPRAHGTEMLSSGTAKSLTIAQAVQSEVVAALGTRDRGVHTVPPRGRGGRSLIAGKAPAVLAEPFFGSSPSDDLKTDELRERVILARAYLKGVAKALNALPRPDLKESRTMAAVRRQRGAQRLKAQASVGAGISTAAMQAKDSIASIHAIGALADWLPYIALALVGVIFLANAYDRLQTERIETARRDDHNKGMEL